MSICDVVASTRFYNTLACLKLSESMFWILWKLWSVLQKTFELEWSIRLTQSIMKDIEADLKASGFIPRAGLARFKRHICTARNAQQRSTMLKFVNNECPIIFGVSHLNAKAFFTFWTSNMTLIRRNAKWYQTNPDKPMSSFSVRTFYEASVRYVRAYQVLVSEIRSKDQYFLVCTGLLCFMATR